MTKEEMQILLDMFDERLTDKLQPLQNDILAISSKQDAMQNDIRIAQKDIETISARQNIMDNRLTRIELKIENETDRAIKILSEGIEILNRKMDEHFNLEQRVEVLEHKVSAVEYVLKK
jgi:peptidoglycan hydrolase CwlO-like protein